MGEYSPPKIIQILTFKSISEHIQLLNSIFENINIYIFVNI